MRTTSDEYRTSCRTDAEGRYCRIWDVYRQGWIYARAMDAISDEVMAALPESDRRRITAHLPAELPDYED